VYDRKPPRLAVGELDTLLALLRYQRESLVRKVEGIAPEQATWSPVPSGTNLLWLVTHMADAEESWMVRRFAGLATDMIEEPPAESADAALAAAVARYRGMWETVDAVVASAADPDARCRGDEAQPPVSLRWLLAHLLEETARHAGHADIIRELVDGRVGR
jgi:predicted PhzF superfamily epimerase YddE/YHI9